MERQRHATFDEAIDLAREVGADLDTRHVWSLFREPRSWRRRLRAPRAPQWARYQMDDLALDTIFEMPPGWEPNQQAQAPARVQEPALDATEHLAGADPHGTWHPSRGLMRGLWDPSRQTINMNVTYRPQNPRPLYGPENMPEEERGHQDQWRPGVAYINRRTLKWQQEVALRVSLAQLYLTSKANRSRETSPDAWTYENVQQVPTRSERGKENGHFKMDCWDEWVRYRFLTKEWYDRELVSYLRQQCMFVERTPLTANYLRLRATRWIEEQELNNTAEKLSEYSKERLIRVSVTQALYPTRHDRVMQSAIEDFRARAVRANLYSWAVVNWLTPGRASEECH